MNLWRGAYRIFFGMFATVAFAQRPTDFTAIPLSSASIQSRWLVATDQHIQANAAGALLLNSSFAHGFRHGYDEGFRVGDLDIQMGRSPRLVITHSQLRQGRHEFKSTFGDKQSFQQGYEAGFKNGYSDAMSGLAYSASERVRTAAAGLRDALAPSRRPYFDEGFSSGYRSAQSSGAPKMTLTPEYVQQYCERTLLGLHPFEYCSGFSRGFVFASLQASVTSDELAGAHPQP